MEALPEFVVGKFRAMQPDQASHPDADLLAAFAESALSSKERGSVMQHLALCENCREILALALPEAHASVVNPSTAQRQRLEWFALPVLRWGALAASVLVISLIGFQYNRHHSASNLAQNIDATTSVKPVVAQNAAASSASSTLTAEVATSAAPAGAPASSGSTPRSTPKRITRSAEASDILAANHVPASLPSAANLLKGDPLEIVKAKDPVPSQTDAEAHVLSPNLPLQTSPQMMLRASPRWAVTSKGSLQRTFDGGKTWEPVTPAPTSEGRGLPVFRTVFASGLDVWAAGAAGALYHSADSGNRWSRVPVADGNGPLLEDITAVEFSNLPHGTLTTSSATVWITDDAGATWHKLQ